MEHFEARCVHEPTDCLNAEITHAAPWGIAFYGYAYSGEHTEVILSWEDARRLRIWLNEALRANDTQMTQNV